MDNSPSNGIVVWFTGLSGSGKSTLSQLTYDWLSQYSAKVLVLDGDKLRQTLSSDLGFSNEDRMENIRRVSEIAHYFAQEGYIVLVAMISPFRESRRMARNKIENDHFIEIFCDCPIEICQQRDPKGLYKKVQQGLINKFTGISSPYEAPEHAELRLETHKLKESDCLERIKSILTPQLNGMTSQMQENIQLAK